jgi:hypothetical protein
MEAGVGSAVLGYVAGYFDRLALRETGDLNGKHVTVFVNFDSRDLRVNLRVRHG